MNETTAQCDCAKGYIHNQTERHEKIDSQNYGQTL